MRLLNSTTHVQSPFIIIKMGNYTFGQYYRSKKSNIYGNVFEVNFPDVIKSMTVIKVNGTVNRYTIQMEYAVTETRDPNTMEKAFGTISSDRRITISYGDWNQPTFIYKEEEAMVTKVTTSVDFRGAKLNYTVEAVSTSMSLTSQLWNFGSKMAKPSQVIIGLLKNKNYGLDKIFTGMRDIEAVIKNGLIPTDDRAVRIQSKVHINVLDYLSYLVGCMTSVDNSPDSLIHSSVYHMAIYDDITNELNGTYFKIIKVPANLNIYTNMNVYEVDVGYPTDTFVTNFQLNTNDSWSLLYKYAGENHSDYSYVMDNEGESYSTPVPEIMKSKLTQEITEVNKNWWTEVTSFPVKANLTITGLLRPAMLMEYVKINSYFYGQRYIASGMYLIIQQQLKVELQNIILVLTLVHILKIIKILKLHTL